MEKDQLFELSIPELSNYRISKNGNVFSKHSNKYIKSRVLNGYNVIDLCNNGKIKTYTVHRLLAQTFIENPNNYTVVNHINENKLDNKLANLEWVTQKENVNKSSKITSHPRKVLQIYEDNVFILYDSLTEAAEEVGLTRHAISKACLGINKTAGGFKWKFEDESYNHENIILDDAKQIDDTNYYIFKNGDIYNKSRKKMLKPIINLNGNYYVTLSNGTSKKNHYVNKLVSQYFNDTSEYCSKLEKLHNYN